MFMDVMMKEILGNCLRENVDSYAVNALVTEFPTIQDLMNASEPQSII